jgi:amino acid transporter
MSTTNATSDPTLDRSIGLGRVLFQSIAAMGPGASIALGLGLIVSYAGRGAPFSMLLGAVGAMIIAYVIGTLARKIPSSGAFYSYSTPALGSTVGFMVGWAYSILYLLLGCLSALNFSLIARDFCTTYLSFTPPYLVLAILVVLFTFVVTYIGIRPSTGLTMILGCVEIAILLLVSVLLIIHAGSANTLSVFTPHAAASSNSSTIHAIFLGMVFAFAALSGFEAAAPLAEEATDPRRTVPKAVLLSAVLIGLFYILAMYTSVIAWGQHDLSGFISSADPWRQMAQRLGGFWAFLVILALLNSVVAGCQAGMNGTSRLLFAMGRAGTMPGVFGRVHPKYKTPANAAIAGVVMTLVFMIAAYLAFGGSFPGFIFFLTVVSLVFIVLYGVICVDCMILYMRNWRSEFNPIKHLLLPVLGLAMLIPTFYYSIQGLSYPSNRALPVLGVWILLGIGFLIWSKMRNVDITADRQRWLASEEPIEIAGKLDTAALGN